MRKEIKKMFAWVLTGAMIMSVAPNVAVLADTTEIGEIEINETNFPDSNLRQAVTDDVDRDKNGKISEKEIQWLTTAYWFDRDIENIKGIEYFTELVDLWLDGNKITTADFSNLPKLEHIMLDNNKLQNINVSKNTQLISLSLSGNTELKSIDISNNTKLMHLSITNCALETIDLSKNTELLSVDAMKNNLTSIDVSANTKLNRLLLNYNNLTTLDVSNNPLLGEDMPNIGNYVSEASGTLQFTNNHITHIDLSKNPSTPVKVSRGGNTYDITVPCSGYDLSNLPGNDKAGYFDLSKVYVDFDGCGAKVEDGKLFVDESGEVTYGYNMGNGYGMTVTLNVTLTHDYDDFTIDKEATCTKTGSKSRHCKNNDSTIEVTEIPATGHKWTYTVDENNKNIVKAYCDSANKEKCEYYGVEKALALDIHAKNITYTGKAYNSDGKDITVNNNITEITSDKASEVKYYVTDENGVKIGNAIAAPTEAGKYVAEVEIGGKVASAVFEITKKLEETTTKKPEETTTQKAVETTTETVDVNKNDIDLNAGLKVSQKGKKIKISWGSVKEADGYDVYVQYCKKKFTAASINQVKSGKVTKINVTKVNGKKLNLKKNYKVYVVAYKIKNGEKVNIATSIRAHIVGIKNNKETNVKQIKTDKEKYQIKVGKKAKINAETVLVDNTKKALSDYHAKEFRYASSNVKVATISENGEIKAIAKGKCEVYVYARNGYAKKINIIVK